MNWNQYRLAIDSEEITDRTEWSVLIALADFADKENAECWAGAVKIAKKARLAFEPSPRSTIDAIKRLIEKGHISVVEKGGGNSKENRYKVHIGKKTESFTMQEMHGKDELNHAGDARNETDTVHSNHETDGFTVHSNPNGSDLPCIECMGNKEEVQSKRNEVVNSEVSSVRTEKIRLRKPRSRDDFPEDAMPYLEAYLRAVDLFEQWRMDTLPHRTEDNAARVALSWQISKRKPEDFQTFVANFPKYLASIGAPAGSTANTPSPNQWIEKADAVLSISDPTKAKTVPGQQSDFAARRAQRKAQRAAQF